MQYFAENEIPAASPGGGNDTQLGMMSRRGLNEGGLALVLRKETDEIA